MMIITRQQYEAFSKDRERRFTARAVEHLREHHPDWCSARDAKALAAYVAAAIAFARDHGVTQQDNVIRLINLQLQPGFAAPLSGYLYYRLTQRGFDETTRVRNFAFALTQSHRPVVITLDTDLDALEHDDG